MEIAISTSDPDHYYWWISKSGRVIIEGPAANVVHAMVETDEICNSFLYGLPLPHKESKGLN